MTTNMSEISEARAFGIAVLLAASPVRVIVPVATDTKAVGQLVAVAIGSTVLAGARWGGSLTGASMTPA